MSGLSLDETPYVTIKFYKNTKSINPVYTQTIPTNRAFISKLIKEAYNEDDEEIPIYFESITPELGEFIINYMKLYENCDEPKTSPDPLFNDNSWVYFIKNSNTKVKEYNMIMNYINNDTPCDELPKKYDINSLIFNAPNMIHNIINLANYMNIKGLLYKMLCMFANLQIFAQTTGFKDPSIQFKFEKWDINFKYFALRPYKTKLGKKLFIESISK